jgi:hypothetical protein
VTALAVLSLTLFGIVGFGRGRPEAILRPDTQILYMAGHMWLQMRSPYPVADFLVESAKVGGLTHDFMRSGFGYPPSAAPLCLLLGVLSLRGAFFAMMGLNLVATGVLAFYAFLLVGARLRAGVVRDSLRWFVPAVVVGNPFTAHIVYQGQTTLLATAAVVAAWHYAHVARRPVLAGVLFAVSTMKPQVALLAIAWVVLEHQWSLLLSLASTTSALLVLPVVAGGGPFSLLTQWLHEVATYSAVSTNAPGFQNVFGVQSLLASCGVHFPAVSIFVVPCLAWIWWRRPRFAIEDLLGILLGVSCLFIYAHDYDLAALAPAYATVWKRSARSTTASAGALAFFGAMFAPQRFLRHATSGPLLHWREVALLVAMVWLLMNGFRRSAAGVDRAEVAWAEAGRGDR